MLFNSNWIQLCKLNCDDQNKTLKCFIYVCCICIGWAAGLIDNVSRSDNDGTQSNNDKNIGMNQTRNLACLILQGQNLYLQATCVPAGAFIIP